MSVKVDHFGYCSLLWIFILNCPASVYWAIKKTCSNCYKPLFIFEPLGGIEPPTHTDTESAIREGRHLKIAETKKHALVDLVDRYIKDVLPIN